MRVWGVEVKGPTEELRFMEVRASPGREAFSLNPMRRSLPLGEAHTPCPGVRTTRLEDSVWSSKASRNTKNFPSIASQFLENWTRVTATMNPRWDWILLAPTGRRQLEPLEQNQLMRMLPSRHTAKLKYRSISGIMIGFACSE